MADRPFVHLHCHSHYSLLDGASRIPELVAHVKKRGMNAVALTDHGNLYGAIEFYRESVLPAIEELEGFCSASLMIDRTSWRAVSSSTFDSLDAMERNGDQARSLRTARLRDLGADQFDVGEFELAIAHLRVPELV